MSKVKLTGPPFSDQLWELLMDLEEGQEISSHEIAKKMGCHKDLARKRLRLFLRAGYLSERAVKEPKTRGAKVKKYSVIRRALLTPRLDKNGQEDKKVLLLSEYWRVMQMKSKFTTHDLVQLTSSRGSLNGAQKYVGFLKKAGYLKQVSAQGSRSSSIVYTLIPSMNTGPQPPALCSTKEVYDRNLQKIVYREGGPEHE